MSMFRNAILLARKPWCPERIYLTGVFVIWWTTIYSKIDGLLLGNDDRYPLSAPERFMQWQHVYSDYGVPYLSHGGLWPFKIATLFPSVSMQAFCQWTGLSYELCQRIEYGFLLGFLFFGTYWLGRVLFRSPHAGYFALLGVYSTELKFHLHISHELFYSWAITPFLVTLMVLLIEKADETGKISLKRMVGFSICSLLIAPGAVNFPLFVAAILFGIIITALKVFNSSSKPPVIISIIGALALTLVAHSFWLIPSIYSFGDFTGSLQYDNVGWARNQSALNSFPAVLFRLRLDIGNFEFSSVEMGEFGTGLLGFCVMLAIGGYAIVRRVTILIFLFAMFLTIVFLGKGVRGPMGFIFLDLPHVFPLIEWFRSAFDKFSLPQTFLYSMFVGLGMSHILVWAKNRAFGEQTILLLIIVGLTLITDKAFENISLFAIPIVLAFFADHLRELKKSQFGLLTPAILIKSLFKKWPFWGACIAAALINPFVYNLYLNTTVKDFPKEYQEVKDIVQQDKERYSYKFIRFPHTTNINAKDFSTGGSYNLFEELTSMGMENRLSNSLTNIYSLNNSDHITKFKKSLNIAPVKYIIIAKEAKHQRASRDEMEKLFNILSSDPDFKLLLDNSRVAMFTYIRPIPIVEFLDQEIPFPIHMTSYLYYKFSLLSEGEILMRRPFDRNWKLKTGDTIIAPKLTVKDGIEFYNKTYMSWSVKADNEYELYYALDKVAQVGKWISILYVIFSLAWLAGGVWRRKEEGQNH
jgi:hypothetical protein